MRRFVGAVLAAVMLLGATNAAPVLAGVRIDARTNHFRANHDRSHLRSSETLHSLAKRRAHQISRSFNHRNWSWFFNRLPKCVRAIGENIAYKTTDWNVPGWPTSAWEHSAPHRENMLGTWHWQGSAVYRSGGFTYAVQLFLYGCRHHSTL